MIRAEQVTINFFFLPAVLCDSCAHLAGTALIPVFKSLVKELVLMAT